MNLLLAAVLLMQDKTAEETFRKIEETIEQATSLKVRITYTMELPTKFPGSPAQQMSTKAEILIADRNRVRVVVDPNPMFKGGRTDLSVRSDGKLLRVVDPGEDASEGKAPQTTTSGFKTLLGRAGYFGSQDLVPKGLMAAGEDPDLARFLRKDLKKELALSGLEAARDTDGDFLKYTVHGQIPMRLWYTPKTHLPARRIWELPFPVPGNLVIRCTEVYDEFTLNADIPDEKFKLPEEKK